MEYDKEVFGIQFPSSQLRNLEEDFDVIREFDNRYDEPLLAVSKKLYKHDLDEDLKFDYRYIIEVETCEGNIFYSLYLVPEFKSLSKKNQEKVQGDCDGEPTVEDVYYYGMSILMKHEMIEGCIDIDMDKVNCINSVIFSIDGLRGFELDRCQNRIGSTGWDYLNEYINDINAGKAALERWKAEQGK